MRWIAGLLIATLCGAQMPLAKAQNPADPVPITVPQGTRVPLILVNVIHSKSTRPGDTVRAQVAFPIAVGTQTAIPAGTYVEGSVLALTPRGAGGLPGMQIHFTRLLFANGYAVPLDAANTQALLLEPEPGRTQATVELADARDGAPMLGEPAGAAQTTPTAPSIGPNPTVVTGALVGAATLSLVLALTLNHHRITHADYVLFDSGWQFEMVLDQPLVLDMNKVATAANRATD